jgi:peroxiredoxin Q/BCP
MLEPGKIAPGFGVQETDGELVHLSEFKGEKNVVLYFYPKDDTPGCTIEAQQFTALKDNFNAADTVVLGVSKDDCASHAAFRDKFGLTVQLLADTDGDLCEKYGVWQEKEKNGVKKMGVVRSTFIIDKEGIVRHAIYNVTADGHAQEVLDMVRGL